MKKPVFGGYLTRSDTNRAVQSLNMARGLKFPIQKVEGLYYPCSENNGPDQLRGSEKLFCAFVFAYTNIRFSHDTALIISGVTNPHTPNVQSCFIKATKTTIVALSKDTDQSVKL